MVLAALDASFERSPDVAQKEVHAKVEHRTPLPCRVMIGKGRCTQVGFRHLFDAVSRIRGWQQAGQQPNYLHKALSPVVDEQFSQFPDKNVLFQIAIEGCLRDVINSQIHRRVAFAHQSTQISQACPRIALQCPTQLGSRIGRWEERGAAGNVHLWLIVGLDEFILLHAKERPDESITAPSVVGQVPLVLVSFLQGRARSNLN